MTSPDSTPIPREDEDNRAFLEAWRNEGKILLQKAADGGRPFFYPRPICPYTGSADLVALNASGKGRIVSFSLVRRPNHPAFKDEVPIILAEIVLGAGACLLARIICDDPGQIASGLPVETLADSERRHYPLPTFRLSESFGPEAN